MAGKALTVSSTLQCPHGGQVMISSGNAGIEAAGASLATASDQFTISGCPFQLPGPTPSPCVSVMWTLPDTRVRVNRAPTLSESSVGLCLSAAGAPQGTVLVVNTQQKAATR